MNEVMPPLFGLVRRSVRMRRWRIGRDEKKAHIAPRPSNPETETFIAMFIFRSHTTKTGSAANTRSVKPVRAACA